MEPSGVQPPTFFSVHRIERHFEIQLTTASIEFRVLMLSLVTCIGLFLAR